MAALVNGGGDAIVSFNRRDYLDADRRLAAQGRLVVPVLSPNEAFVMASYSNYPLRVPASLMTDLRAASEFDGVSMNGFVIQAVAEKIAVLRARVLTRNVTPEEQASYLHKRAVRSAKGSRTDLIGKAGSTDTVLPGDEIPDDWLTQAP